MIELIDNFNRVHDYLRISLTDKCNLNCIYCNPARTRESEKTELLSFEELGRIIGLFVKRLGVKKLRFTGGEPFARKDALQFIASLKPLKEEYKVTLGITTNGTLIKGKLGEIREAGIDYINISLDTLHKDKFRRVTGKSLLDDVLTSIEEAKQAGFTEIKINSVIIRGINDNEINNFIVHFKDSDVQLRFIEFMPSKDNAWGAEGYISADEITEIIRRNFTLTRIENADHSVSKNFKVNDYPLSVGLITPISHHFCSSCNRLRITAMGDFKTCLFWTRNDNVNFKNLIRYNYTDEDICALIVNSLRGKWSRHPGLSKLTQLQQNNMLKTGG